MSCVKSETEMWRRRTKPSHGRRTIAQCRNASVGRESNAQDDCVLGSPCHLPRRRGRSTSHTVIRCSGSARSGAVTRKIVSRGNGCSAWPMTGSHNHATSTPGRKCVLPSNTRGKNRMPELGPSGSARGAVSNHRSYRDLMHRSIRVQ